MSTYLGLDINITDIHQPKDVGDKGAKFIIYFRGENRETKKDVYGMLYLDPVEMEKLQLQQPS